jgi:hypothetical protein
MNNEKTAVRWFSWWANLAKSMCRYVAQDCLLQIKIKTIHPGSVVCIIKEMSDAELSMKQHTVNVAMTCLYHL